MSHPAGHDQRHVATAERSGVEQILSFDRAIDRVGTMRRIEPTFRHGASGSD